MNFSISDIVTRSLKLAWQHKILWVFALMLGSGLSFNNSFSNFSNSFSKGTDTTEQEMDLEGFMEAAQGDLDQLPQDADFESFFEGVVGTTNGTNLDDVNISPEFSDVIDPGVDPELLQFLEIVKGLVPHITFITISIILFMLFTVSVGLIIRSWALGAFLGGLNDAIGGTHYDLKKLGSYGRISMKELLKLKIFLTVISFALILILLAPPILLLISENEVFGFILIALTVLLMFIFMVVVGYANTFATRFVALKQFKFMDAFKEGFNIFKKNLVKVVTLSLTNCAVYFAFGVAALVVFGIIGFGSVGLFTLVDNESMRVLFTILMILVGVPLFIAFVVGIMVFGSYITTYKNFTWSIFFNFVTGNSPEESKVASSEVKQDGK